MARRSALPPKRRFRRRTARVLVDYAAGGAVRCEYATTLGAGGMFLESDEPLPLGTPVKLRFRLAPDDLELHEIDGRVAWREASDEQNPLRIPGMGIEFTDAVATARLARALERPDDEDDADPEATETR